MFALLAVFLTACGGVAVSKDELSQDMPSPSESITEEAEQEVVATPEQVASVIAGAETDWRKVIDEAFDCRWTWTMGGGGPTDEAESMACYMRETTIGHTAETAMDELASLNVPASMTSLVSETSAALQRVVDVDLEGACGVPWKGPKDSKTCSQALGSRMGAYTALESALDKWGPYL